MAEQSQNPGATTNSFTKGMVKDLNDTFVGEGLWTHARNAVNNSNDGQVGVLGNEPSNLHCANVPYTLIGAIHLTDDEWALFSTDDVNSEIGLFDESKCQYTTVINDPCLNFKRSNLITGAFRRKYDCGRPVYWADGLNPDRYMDLDDVPYKCKRKLVSGGVTELPPVYSYTVANPGVASNVIKGKLTFTCADTNEGNKPCKKQGHIRIKFELDKPAPAGGLKVKFGWLDGGNNVIIPTAYGYSGLYTVPSGYNPATGDNAQPGVVTIPAGQTTYTQDTVILSTFNSPNGPVYTVWTCLCGIALEHVYVKSDTPGTTVSFSSTDGTPMTNLDQAVVDSGTTVTINYKDIDGLVQKNVQLLPGQSKTVCAYENTVTVSNPVATITKGLSCVTIEDDSCYVKECTTQLDCEKLRIAPLITQPCINISKGKVSGTLPNGSYQACLAYSVNQVRVTNYIGLSEVQPLFSHENVSSSLELNISQIDTSFDEFELVILAAINGATVAKKIGYYSTAQGTIFIDRWSQEYETVPVSQIVVRTEPIEKSDAMYTVNNYLFRVGSYSKYKFNYQPLANKIRSRWVAVQYPSNYYKKGGNNAGYLRDEQYAFFIRWVYNTGERSESYHIPGRAPMATDLENHIGEDAFETLDGVQRKTWQVENTYTVDVNNGDPLPDGGVVVAKGKMGYWESTEKYPDNRPDIWGDLCGKHIRHHKMPDETQSPLLSTFNSDGENIVILGVEFDNIYHPLDQNGQPITSIVGYEILRGSREGNKSIIGKGLINNMREYKLPGNDAVKGLFQNYPYNDLRPDVFLTEDEQTGENGKVNVDSTPMSSYSKKMFSFHSPETTFSNPFLNPAELKVYQIMHGNSTGQFRVPYKHPKFKLVSEFGDYFSKLLGVVGAIASFTNGVEFNADGDVPMTTKTGPFPYPPVMAYDPTIVGTSSSDPIAIGWNKEASIYNGVIQTLVGINSVVSIVKLAVEAAIVGMLTAEKAFNLIKILVPKVQYAAQYDSHGFYNQGVTNIKNNTRFRVNHGRYINPGVQQFLANYQVQNTNRSKVVVFDIHRDLRNTQEISSVLEDKSRISMSDAKKMYIDKTSKISSYYGALKISIPSQYGQLESIKQIPITGGCIYASQPSTATRNATPVMYGGDTYINRFTEKNTMSFFTDWLMGEPDETEYDYTLYINTPYPRYWINNSEQRHHLFSKGPQRYRSLDFSEQGGPNFAPKMYVKKGHFYLFNSGVRDFFVESEINLALRDWEEDISKRHYDHLEYTDIHSMFRSDIIKSANFYKYDYNLSVSRMFSSHITWGSTLPRDYDPQTYATCYTYRPNRVLYSLPQEEEVKKDNWRIFLTNNYKDFQSKVTSIKSINKTGALFMMKYMSPMQFMGVEELKMDGTGAKITIGDGGLFQQPMQAVVNAEASFEYGSCQNRSSVINTTHGVFWVSQNQGKVFQYAGQLDEISRNNMKWWFSKYLPSELLKVYPDYQLYDNAVAGIGVQTMYDNTNEVLYITKKDYKPKRTDLLLDEKGFYYVSGTDNVTIPGVAVDTCPPGYTLQNGTCVKVDIVDPIQTGETILLAKTPYETYGYLGTRVYDNADVDSTFTLLNTANTFWKRQPVANWSSLTPDQKQVNDLNNGPVNRLAVWGRKEVNGVVLNNYNHAGVNLDPVNTWTGFDVCVNIPATKTYYVCIAADNRYRMLLDGVLVLEDQKISSNFAYTATFNYLHIFPVEISAGVHILRLEGYNDGAKACFGVEIFDLDNLPAGMGPVAYLNAQTNYNELDARTIFTTRTATQFTSNLFSCPAGYGIVNPSCDSPECRKVLTQAPTVVTTPAKIIQVPHKVYVPFSNKEFWEDASWTISYDPKNKMWLSFHDWKPTFMLPSKTHFMTVDYSTIWKHNVRCDSFCNFYGKSYPFEVEFISATGQMVNSVRNIEYLLEAYKFYNDCRDKYHILDENFDQAIIHNSEQVSGLLELNIKPKNDPLALLQYPKINPASISILFSKEEQKYRFNQFWDITKDRGEFSGAQTPLLNIAPNGYEISINPTAVDYQKQAFDRKKFRHNVNKVFLRKLSSADVKLLFKLSNQKLLQSPR